MKISLCCCLAAGLSFAAAGRADEPPIIAEARAYVGSEAALDGLKSVHLVGRMAVETPGDPAKGATAQIDIIFQKPWRECVTVVSSEGILRTALDGYDGWHLEQRLEPGQAAVFDPHRVQQLTILDPERVKGLRTDTWENLSYYRGLEAAGGRIEDQGPATVDGVACEKVALIHSADTIYYRYFDQATGRLVYSETVKGAKIRERGEIVAGGIRFAKTIDVLELPGREGPRHDHDHRQGHRERGVSREPLQRAAAAAAAGRSQSGRAERAGGRSGDRSGLGGGPRG